MAVDIREPEVAPLKLISQPFMIDAEEAFCLASKLAKFGKQDDLHYDPSPSVNGPRVK